MGSTTFGAPVREIRFLRRFLPAGYLRELAAVADSGCAPAALAISDFLHARGLTPLDIRYLVFMMFVAVWTVRIKSSRDLHDGFLVTGEETSP